MKKRITYGLLTIVFFGGLYFGLRFSFGLFTPYNFWTARQDIKKGKIQIAEVGELPLNYGEKQSLANSYGFKFYYFGCTVTKDIINGTKYYNQTMVEHLEKKYGHGWWTKFQTQLDNIDNSKRLDLTVEKVTDLVSDLKIVKDEIKLVDSLSKGKRHILLLPFLNDTAKNIYLVKVAEDNGTNYVSYFNFLVDGNLMKILNESGKLDGQ
ncbi:MAG: hypothetical protein KGM16_16355 [Bacteroidota bacterium]|nr:hypothetical protein [Bacteroidota bacterium]